MVVFPDARPELKLFKETGLEYKIQFWLTPVSRLIWMVFMPSIGLSLFVLKPMSKYEPILASQADVLVSSIAGDKRDFVLPREEGFLALKTSIFNLWDAVPLRQGLR